MRNLLLLFTLLFTLNACGDTKEESDKHTKFVQKENEASAQKDALLEKLKSKDKALEEAREKAKNLQAKLLAEEKAKKESFLQKEARKKEKEEYTKTQQNQKLSSVGITIEKNKITIDTNKTKNFFQSIGKKFGEKLKKITQDLEKGVVNEKDAGVKIDETHINIDLNKSKNFLETWGRQLQGIVKEFDTIAKDIDNEKQHINQTK